MKNRRILAVKENDSFTFLAPSTTTTLSDKAFPSNTFNQSILFSSFPHFSLLNSSNDSSTPENPYGNPYDLSARMNPSIGIIIVILLSAFFFLGIFSIYVRRCGSGEDNTTGNSRRGGGGNGRMNRASQGLDKNIIETFPVSNYSLVKGLKQGNHTLECAVCLSEFEDDEALRLLPKCNHAFHPDCIDMWLFSHTTCPLCRSSLLPAPHGIVQGLRVDVEGQPQQRPLQTNEQVVVVIGARNALHDRVDNQGRVTNEMISFDVRVPSPSVGQARVCNEHNTSDTDSPIRGIMDGKPREKRSQNFRRSHSTGHSLVRLGGNPEHPSEFYISTDDGYVVDFAENLIESSKSGLHRSISYAAFCYTGSPGFSNSKAFVNSRERLWRYPSSTDEACRCFNPCSSTGAEAETGQEFGRISQNGFDPRINL